MFKTIESCIQEDDLTSIKKIISSGKECGRRLYEVSFGLKERWVLYSIELGRLEILKYFVKHFLSLANVKPLYYAAFFDRREIIEYLLSLNESPFCGLEGAVASCNLSLCEYFYSLCRPIDWNMLLFDVVETYDKNMIRWCVDKLDNVELVNCSIFEALYDGSQTTEEIVEMIDFLVDELGIATEGGLCYIVSEGTIETVKYFVQKGYASKTDIRVSARDALINNDQEKVSYLFEHLEDGPKFARKIIRRVLNFYLSSHRRKFEVKEEDESFIEPDNVSFLLSYLEKDEASQVFLRKVVNKLKKLPRYLSMFEDI